MGRFINADEYVSTGMGIIGYNMFAYCNNNPIMYVDSTGNIPAWLLALAGGLAIADGPLPIGEIFGIAVIAIGIYATTTTTEPQTIVVIDPRVYVASDNIKKGKQPKKDPVLPPLISPVPAPDIPQKESKPSKPTYYHATSAEKAALIWASGQLIGSTWEGGYVYAWKRLPSEKAVQMSGAHSSVVIISFQTNAAFVSDPGITDPYVRSFGPLQSALGRPVGVSNVQIVARY